jgi:hypothetical protein
VYEIVFCEENFKKRQSYPRHEEIRGSGGIAPPFLISAIEGSEWAASRLRGLVSSTHCIGGWVGPIAGLDGIFFIASGVGLSPLYCGHFWPIVAAPDDR